MIGCLIVTVNNCKMIISVSKGNTVEVSCCPFYGSGSVVVVSLFNIAPNVCGVVFGPCFVMQF